MNGIGVGTAVAIGIEVSSAIFTPDLVFYQVAILMVLFGAIFGFIFQIYKIAFSNVRPPFGRPW